MGVLSTLDVHLLGDFRLTYGGEPVRSIDTARLQSLFAYLVLHSGAPQSRQHLSFRFWPDSSEAQARTNLRQLLYHLRHALPDPDRFLCVDTRTVQWRPDAPYDLDVADFEHAVVWADEAEQRADQDAARAALKEAAELYRGDLLPGCYEDWIEPERERLRHRYTEVLERLAAILEEHRAYGAAVSCAERLLRQNPLRETSYRSLMRLHALSGDRAAALHVYHDCVKALRQELGVDPDPATRALHERLLKARATPEREGAPRSAVPAVEFPLVGRRTEWERLREAWHTAAHRGPRVVLVTGEAGIGKTRLAEELLQWTGSQGMAAARAHCYAAEGRLAYAPVTEWLRADALQEALRVLEDPWLSEVARLLPELLAERPDLRPPEPLTQGFQRGHLFEALSRAVLAAEEPLLLMVDDLQWCDAETLEWLRYLMRFESSTKLLIVGTVRTAEVSEDHPLRTLLLDLRRSNQVDEVTLGPLASAETASLAASVAGRDLDEVRTADLYRDTEGNPLFVVESVRAGLLVAGERTTIEHRESSQVAPSLVPGSESLPPKVYAVITFRLSQLSPQARELVGLAATIGRAFTLEVLAEASERGQEHLVRALDELWERHVVHQHGAESYDFGHDKLREVAYAEISPARRRLLHRKVAHALERVHASNLDSVSGQLAAHYRQASLPEQAIRYYQRAGEWALRLSAYEEATAHLTRGLKLLESLPDTPERTRQELGLQIALGATLQATKGYGAPEVERVYGRARALSRQAAEIAQLAPVLFGLCGWHLVRAELLTARDLAGQLLSLARAQDDPTLLIAGHFTLGRSLFHLGELSPAREHLEQALSLYEPRHQSSYVARFGLDPRASCLSYMSHVLWHLGYPDQALEKSHEALALARDLSHPFSMAAALDYAAMLHQFRREEQAARERAEAATSLCGDRGFAYYLAWGSIMRGWVLSERGEEEGLKQIRQALKALRATGATLRQTYYLALLAEAYGNTDQVKEGLVMLDEALTAARTTGERYYEAELHRLKGSWVLAQGGAENQAEGGFGRAVDVARRQGARALELRAATSLAHLWYKQGKKAQGRKLLEETYSWFGEGFDTPDLKEARTLLEELT